MEGNLSFAGINEIEARDRVDSYHTGVPAQGGGLVVLDAPAGDARKGLAGVRAVNFGAKHAHVRLRHGGSLKTQTSERLISLNPSGNIYRGKLGRRSVSALSVSITNAGAPLTIVDDGAGRLYDTGFVGVAANLRGTIDYVRGIINFTFGAAPTQPVLITYQHRDYTDFVSPGQSNLRTAAGAYPESFTTSFGRVVPFSLSLTDGVLTFVDDGKGNMVQTAPGANAKRGTIDYATGVISLASGSAPLSAVADAIVIAYSFNPFASLLAAGGGSKPLNLYPGTIPELSVEPWADGIKGEASIGLWAESRDAAAGTALHTEWSHYGEDPFRVNAPYSGALPGGESNNPAL